MITITIYYHGKNDSARRFAAAMTESGTAEKIRAVPGNIRYEYYLPVEDSETVLLIDSWDSQDALDRHHASDMMQTITELREQFDLHMEVYRYISDDMPEHDRAFLRP